MTSEYHTNNYGMTYDGNGNGTIFNNDISLNFGNPNLATGRSEVYNGQVLVPLSPINSIAATNVSSNGAPWTAAALPLALSTSEIPIVDFVTSGILAVAITHDLYVKFNIENPAMPGPWIPTTESPTSWENNNSGNENDDDYKYNPDPNIKNWLRWTAAAGAAYTAGKELYENTHPEIPEYVLKNDKTYVVPIYVKPIK